MLFARRSGDDGYIHGGGPGMWIEQGEGGAAQGCAGRVGVVDKQDALAPDFREGKERALEVGDAFGFAQAHLMPGGVLAEQQIGHERHAEGIGQGAGQFLALIESALAQPRGVQGHGDDGVGLGQILAGEGEEPPEQVQHGGVGAELAAQEERFQRAAVCAVEAEMLPRRRRLLACLAQGGLGV